MRVIHYNPKMKHQCDHARAFEACGFKATTDPKEPADIHVVSGPYYAKPYWLDHPRVIEIDRAWWGDPHCISIGWMQPDGTRRFATGLESRQKPEMAPWWDVVRSCLILADFQQDTSEIETKARDRFGSVKVRRHPAEQKSERTLNWDIRSHDVAIGTSGTSIFEAIKAGTPSICLDPKNECAPVCSGSIDEDLYRGDRDDWIHNMSYKQFNLDEIDVAWNLLKAIQ